MKAAGLEDRICIYFSRAIFSHLRFFVVQNSCTIFVRACKDYDSTLLPNFQFPPCIEVRKIHLQYQYGIDPPMLPYSAPYNMGYESAEPTCQTGKEAILAAVTFGAVAAIPVMISRLETK